MAEKSRQKKGDHGHERPRLYGGVEGEPEAGLVEVQEVLGDQQVPGAGVGQELGEPLYHPQQQRLDEF